MTEYPVSENSALRRNASFASYDRELTHSLIHEVPYCHLAAQINDVPYLQPTVHWREGDMLYVHGVKKNKMVHAIAKGGKAVLSFTRFDGYILTRSAFARGVSYRSVTLFGAATEVVAPMEECRVLRLFLERISRGRWDRVRPPTAQELAMTGLLRFTISDVSGKTMMQGRQLLSVLPGGEYELPADSAFNPWTGLYPYVLARGEPISSEQLLARYGNGAEGPPAVGPGCCETKAN
jgi:nitroimidazol reductase NimA-like FMN-containing flavoprotein (pyridoxamine 5'-phosphate oxidase superfamily)